MTDDVSHGTEVGYRKGCRCSECKGANAARHREQRRKRTELARTDPTQVPHGRYGYGNYGCRCEVCRAAHSVALKEGARKRKERNADAPHGTKAGYKGWGCRCESCRAANNKTDRKSGVRRGEPWDREQWQREYKAAWQKRKREYVAEEGLPDGVGHGTSTGASYGCRCEACRSVELERKSEWDSREQAHTLPTASNHGKQWTGTELEIVATRRDLTLTQLAKLLGRTRAAVRSARNKAMTDPKWISVAGVPASGSLRRPA